MKRVLSAILFLLLFLTSLLSGIADASPSLIGDTVSWMIYLPEAVKPFVTVDPKYVPFSAVVDNDYEAEFTGFVSTVAAQQWQISMDIYEQSFMVGFIELYPEKTNDFNREPSGDELLKVSLTDLDWVGMPGAIITKVLCEYSGNPKDNKFRQVSFGADFIDVSFKGLHNGDTYVFSIEAAQQPTPVPPSILLFGSGLAGIAAIRKKFDKQS